MEFARNRLSNGRLMTPAWLAPRRSFFLERYRRMGRIMTETLGIATVWLGLAVFSTILANHLRVSMALMEICVGVAAGAIIEHYLGNGALGSDVEWLRFLAGSGAILLTFLAGAELEPAVLRSKWSEVTVIGLVGFLAPFLGCAALARYVLGWDPSASWLV